MWLDLNLFDDLFCDKDPLVFFNLSMMAQVILLYIKIIKQ